MNNTKYDIHINGSIKLYGNTKKKYLVLLKNNKDELKYKRINFISCPKYINNVSLYTTSIWGGFTNCTDIKYEFYVQIIEKNEEVYDLDIFNSEYCNYDGLNYKWNMQKKCYIKYNKDYYDIDEVQIILDFWDLDELENHRKYFREKVWKELMEEYYSPYKKWNKNKEI